MQGEALDRARLHPDVLKNLSKNKKLKAAESYSEDNPPPYPVTSVNGQTGDVEIQTVELPVSVQDGGTGAGNAEDARTNLGLGNVATENVVPLNKGGTGATSVEGAIANLGFQSGSNYCKMPDGTLICCGVGINVTSEATINFPSPFVGWPVVVVTPNYNHATTIRCIFSVAGVTASSAKVYAWDTTTNAISASTTLTFYWQAIGRWK